MEHYYKDYFVYTDYIPTDLYPITYGEEQCVPGHSFGPAIRMNFIVHYVYSGCGILRIGEKEYNLKAGDCFLIRSGELAYYKADECEPWFYRWIEFNGSLSQQITSAFNNSPICSDKQLVGDKLISLVKCGNMRFEKVMEKLWGVIGALSVNSLSNKRENSADYVKAAEIYIKNNIHKKLTVTDVANHIKIDRSYLSRLFSKEKNISPQQYICQTKMKLAAQYLQNIKISVAEAAQSVGYCDYRMFNKLFKRYYGVSPSIWRKKQCWQRYIL